MKNWITTAALATAVTFAAMPQAEAQDDVLDDEVTFVDENADGVHDGFRYHMHRRGIARFAEQLTGEQLAELEASIAELKE
jgi:hypothetical protein